MARVVVRVQAVWDRLDMARRLRAQLGQDAAIRFDWGKAGAGTSPWRGYQRCLESVPMIHPAGAVADYPLTFTHLLVIQDDATICRNFMEVVHRIAENNDCPVCLFTPGAKVVGNTVPALRQAMKRRSPYVTLHPRDLMPAVAILWPIGLIPSVLEYAAAYPNLKDGRPATSDDAKLGEWKHATKQKVLLTVPSLVEHLDVVPSVIHKHRGGTGTDKGRRAFHYIGTADPLDIPW